MTVTERVADVINNVPGLIKPTTILVIIRMYDIRKSTDCLLLCELCALRRHKLEHPIASLHLSINTLQTRNLCFFSALET